MSWIGELVYGILRAVLPWLFSGEETHKSSEIVGLDDLDHSTLAGKHDDLPLLCVAILALSLSGCALGGARVKYRTVFVEPGGVARIATDKKLPVVGKDDKGNDVYEKRNVGGHAIVPLSVYRELRESWQKQHSTEVKQ